MDAMFRLQRLLSAVDIAVRDCASGKEKSADRYRMAMIARALSVVERELEFGVDAPERRLNLQIYGEEMGELKRLATDIRSRSVTEESHPELGRALRHYVEERLMRWNPAHGALPKAK